MKVTVKKPFTHGAKKLAEGDTVNLSPKEITIYGKQGKVEKITEAKAPIKKQTKKK